MGKSVSCAKKKRLRWLILALLLTLTLLLIAFIGFGSKPTGTISGKVTFEGKTVVCGFVTVYASDKRAWNGAIDKEGNYTIENVAVGEARIGVISPDPNVEFDWTLGRRKKSREPEKAPKPIEVLEQWFSIPLKYTDPELSGLTFTIKEGTNTHDITLNKLPPKVDES